MRTKSIILTGCLAVSWFSAGAQLQDGYITWGTSSDKFHETMQAWRPGAQVSEDDNFFISRVKPRARFRNTSTQVRQNLTVDNDKKLIAWLPWGDPGKNAIPDGVFDGEVFSLWSYVTHWGDFSAPIGRIPAALADVAHKNGVAVSGVASVPYGGISNAYQQMFTGLTAVEPARIAKYMRYYGIDGLGYNSEFSCDERLVKGIQDMHENVVKELKPTNPLVENIWYDGTDDEGFIRFDLGLGNHNDENFGDGEHVRTSLFFNYNWNNGNGYFMQSSVNKANAMGRSPLDLYAGFNIQGGEPRSGERWPLLAQHPYSIGLWGAHSQNMFWESRGQEMGSDPEMKQRAYMLRTERWFSSGTRNPANCPALSNSMNYSASNTDFHGMSSMMSARSALSWNLSEEPFISYFNLGNGKFFNWKGVRQNDREWTNVGVQDYLPTWRWWFASSLLGGTAADVPASGLDAEFVWDEAYVGGSSVRVFGTTSDEYLHLFKTEYALQEGDVITFRYKVLKGQADINLILTAVGAEATPIDESAHSLLTTDQNTDEDEWVARTFTVGSTLAGKKLALVALHFRNATDLDLRLGECSIVRGTSITPQQPQIASAKVLSYGPTGVDGKLIFNMPNTKDVGEPCYNIDVNTSWFQIYAQQEGQEPILMGVTTSWAALVWNAPIQFAAGTQARVRFGAAALSLDMTSASEIAWSDYMDAGTYTYNDDIQIDKNTIKPGESFTLSYVDPNHESGTWQITDANTGEILYQGTGQSVTVEEGLSNMGVYNVTITGYTYAADGVTRTSTARTFPSYVQITGEGVGAVPEIYTLTANGKETDVTAKIDEVVDLAYTGRSADGSGSRGIELQEKPFGAKTSDLGIVGNKTFTVAYWIKFHKIEGYTQFFAIVNRNGDWPLSNWGWNWSGITESGQIEMTWRKSAQAENPPTVKYEFMDTHVPVGSWVHVAIVADFNASGAFHSDLYINGIKQTPSAVKNNGATVSDGYFQMGTAYTIPASDVLTIGGDSRGRSGIDGVIDNFQVWRKALTAEEVKVAMSDLDPNNLPDGLTYFWSFENEPDANHFFQSTGSGTSIPVGLHEYVATGQEGQGRLNWIVPEYGAGCPFVSGSAYPVVTLPTWKAKKGTLTAATGNDQAGTAKVSYKQGGDYEVQLTLSNSWGSDSRTFRVIRVDDEDTGINGPGASALRTYTVGDVAYIEFADAGNYSVQVCNLAGQIVATKNGQLSAGAKMRVQLGQPGTYIVSIKKDGRTVRSAKLLRR